MLYLFAVFLVHMITMCLHLLTPKICDVMAEFEIKSTNNPLIDIFLYSHSLSA